MRLVLCVAILGCLGFLGCDDKPEAPATGAPPQPAVNAPASDPVAKPPEYKPEYTVAIEESKTDPKQYSVVWTAHVNSGGWTMTTDSVLVEDAMGKMAARIWVTLEQPGPSDTVTQAMQTLTGKHDAGTTQIERVEFSVRRQIRGVKYDSPAPYGVVKTIKYPY